MPQVVPAQCQLGTLAQPCLFMWEAGAQGGERFPSRRRDGSQEDPEEQWLQHSCTWALNKRLFPTLPEVAVPPNTGWETEA